jgi:hypothetical protein
MRSRWNGLYVAGLYVALRTAVVWCSPKGYEDYRVAAIVPVVQYLVSALLLYSVGS